MNELGKRLRIVRQRHNISRRELARRLLCPMMSLKQWEHGARMPGYAFLQLFGTAFGKEWLMFIMGFGDEPKGCISRFISNSYRD